MNSQNPIKHPLRESLISQLASLLQSILKKKKDRLVCKQKYGVLIQSFYLVILS